MPRNAQIKDNTGWYDYARSWMNYAQQVPSEGQSLDYGTINAAIDAYNTAAATDPGTPEFNARWQTATDAINTMVTANGLALRPGATFGPLDDLRGLGDAMASGSADVDRGIARVNGVVN